MPNILAILINGILGLEFQIRNLENYKLDPRHSCQVLPDVRAF